MKRGFTIHWNGDPARCIGQPHNRCIRFWEAVKRYHMETRGWSDIAYSFGVCPHYDRHHQGLAFFTGRGWDKNQFANGEDQVGANDGPDRDWYTILAFTGTGEGITPSMLHGIQDLITTGRSTVRCGLEITPHSLWKPKDCPGPILTPWAATYNRRSFGEPLQPISQETDDMRILQCAGKPGLLVTSAGHTDLTGLESDALKRWGIEAGTVSVADREAIVKAVGDARASQA